jgi:hypothetical protein
MSRLVAALALVALLGACRVAPCRDGTLYLDIDLLGAAADANELDVAITVDGRTLRDRIAHTPGEAAGGLHVEFEGGYPSGKAAQVRVTAVGAGQPIAFAEEPYTLPAGCGRLALVVDELPDDAAPPADMAMPTDAAGDAAADLSVVASGQVSLNELLTDLPDAGTVRLLAALPWLPSSSQHDFDNRTDAAGVLLGCYADHFQTPNDVPPPDWDAGKITLSGYATTSGARPAIECTRTTSSYGCQYVSDGGTAPLSSLFPLATPLVPTGTLIRFHAAGGASLGSFDQQVNGGEEITVSQDLTTLGYTGQADVTLNLTCSGCLGTAVMVSVSRMPPPTFDVAAPSWGVLVCTYFGAGSVTIPQAAIQAMRAGDPTLISARTVVIGAPSPSLIRDSRNNPITLIVGRGRLAYSTLQ